MPVLRYLMTRTWMSALSLPVAAGAATYAYMRDGDRVFGCIGLTVHQGTNIDYACVLVGFSAIAALVVLSALSLAQESRRILAVLLGLEAVALGIAMSLVAADSATYVASFIDYLCSPPEGPARYVHHVDALFAAWGAPFLLLLLRAVGAWTGVERLERASGSN